MIRVSRRKSLLVGLGLASLLVLMLGASTANATIYEIRSCNASTTDKWSFNGDWGTGWLGDVGSPVADCPNGIRFAPADANLLGKVQVAGFRSDSDSILKTVRFDYYGGDNTSGYEYSIRACDDEDCPALKTFAPGGTVETPLRAQYTFGDLELSEFTIWAECKLAICAEPPPLVAKNFLLVYDDNVAPTVSELQTVPAGVADTSQGPSVRGDRLKVSFSADDSGSGPALAYISIDHLDPLAEPVYLCPNQLGNGAHPCLKHAEVDHTIDIEGLPDGWHTLSIMVLDWAGSPPDAITLPFWIDNQAPGEPTGLELSDNVTEWGWTSDSSVTLSHDLEGFYNNIAGSGWGASIYDIRTSLNAVPTQVKTTEDISAGMEFTLPQEGLWDIGLRYRDRAGNVGNRGHLAVGYDEDSPGPPDLDALGWLKQSELVHETIQEWSPPPPDVKLESGICGYAYALDDELESIPDEVANVISPEQSMRLPADLSEGEHYAHVRSIACNGKASETSTVPVHVDGTAPVVLLHGLQGSGWITSPTNVSLSATDLLSGVASVEYGFDNAPLNVVPGFNTVVTVPQGEHTLNYRTTDIAGNQSAIAQRKVRADWTKPSAQLIPGDSATPNVFSARVEDHESGIESAELQIRRVDNAASSAESAWKPVGEPLTPGAGESKSAVISRAVPDGELAPGSYELRVYMRDVAGNSSSVAPLHVLQLPLRARPSLSAAIALVGADKKIKWSGATGDRVVRYGKKSALVGTLLDGNGDPVAGARIAVSATQEFATPRPETSVITGDSGEFAIRQPIGPTTKFVLRYAGSSKLQPVEQTATIRVRAALDFSVSPRTVRSGKPFVLRGRLLSGDFGLPEGGKIVTIRYLRKREWIPGFATPRVDSNGRFKKVWRDGLTATRPTTVYFQVTAVRDGSWPFLTGSSRIVPLRIKP